MIDARSDPLDLGRLLASVGVERFFADYWQRRALALVFDTGDFARIADAVGPLDISRLAGLARGGVQAWVANEYVAHSVIPVDASNAADYFDIGATLYFLDVPMDRLTHGVADFLGAPRQKVVASLFLTPAAGGASAHFDKNENFTVQLTGSKRWIVAESPTLDAPPDGYVLGRQVQATLAGLVDDVKLEASHAIEMHPGMLLYVPRGVIHRTETHEASWSLNLSYSRAMWLDLLRIGLQRRLAESARWRSTVTGVGADCDPSARAANILPELIAELREILADPQEVERICRSFLDQPNG